MRLEGLQPGTTYQARAVSKNGAGVEAPAEWQTFTTGGIGPGRVDLKTAAWFYSIFACLLFIILCMVGFVFLKKSTDSWWEAKETEIEEQIRQLQAEEAIRQMGIVNHYAQGSTELINASYGDPSADYYHNKPPMDDEGSYDEDDDDAAAGFGKGYSKEEEAYRPPAYQDPNGYQPQQESYDGYRPPPHVGYRQPDSGYRPPQPQHVGYQQSQPHRGSPVENVGDHEPYVQDDAYHLQQTQQGPQGNSASFV